MRGIRQDAHVRRVINGRQPIILLPQRARNDGRATGDFDGTVQTRHFGAESGAGMMSWVVCSFAEQECIIRHPCIFKDVRLEHVLFFESVLDDVAALQRPSVDLVGLPVVRRRNGRRTSRHQYSATSSDARDSSCPIEAHDPGSTTTYRGFIRVEKSHQAAKRLDTNSRVCQRHRSTILIPSIQSLLHATRTT